MKDKENAICKRYSSMGPDQVVPGSVIEKCDFCGAKVWMSPAAKEKKFDKIYCEECFELDFDEKKDNIYFTKEIIEEFNKWHYEKYGFKMKTEDIIKMVEKKKGIKISRRIEIGSDQ